MKKLILSLAVIGLFIAGSTNAAVSSYVVRSGDTLCGIGAKFGIPCKDMIANFPGKNPNLIHPSDKLEFGRPDGLLGGLISKPYTFAPNTIIYSSQVNSNLDTLYTLVNGNLNNANIVAGAAISSTKISGTAIVSTGEILQNIFSSTTIYGGLMVSSTENFFRVPVMTTAQRDALTNVQPGAIIYSTDAGQFFVREGSSWSGITGSGETALANSSTKGIVQEATTSSIFTGTATGTTGARLFVNPTSITTSSDATSKQGYIPALNANSVLHSSFGGAANSLAQLNTSSLVVQNPASATATPGVTANAIPIATASGTLSTNWIATSTGLAAGAGQTLRSGTTGTIWGLIGANAASTTDSRAIGTTYSVPSTTLARTRLITITFHQSVSGSGSEARVAIEVSNTTTPTSKIGIVMMRTDSAVANSHIVPFTFTVIPGQFYRVENLGAATTELNGWWESDL